jgi:hypothetical protein
MSVAQRLEYKEIRVTMITPIAPQQVSQWMFFV